MALLCFILSHSLPLYPSNPFALVLDVVVMTVVRGLAYLQGRHLFPFLSITELSTDNSGVK